MNIDLEEQVRRAFRDVPVPASDPSRVARVRKGAAARRRRNVLGGVSVGVAGALAAVPVTLAVQDLRTPVPGTNTVVAAGPQTPAATPSPLPSPRPSSAGGKLLAGASRALTPAERTFSFVVVPKGSWIELALGCQALTSKRPVVATAALDGRPACKSFCSANPSYRSGAPVDMGSSVKKVVPGRPITVTVTTWWAKSSSDPFAGVAGPLDRAVPGGVVVSAVYPAESPENS